MRKVKSLADVQNVIQRKEDFVQDAQGKNYKLSFILVLQMKLIDLLTMIQEGRLYYESDH